MFDSKTTEESTTTFFRMKWWMQKVMPAVLVFTPNRPFHDASPGR
ncbi:hypothetical protein MRBBS_1093 [Marinobacter sp. BSs20148]|nr:hypothetical protein MRBBS_1093 [Marinobacter sp. BSs20148]